MNLNARVYDPILGRFMSGDPVTGDIFDAQSLNRYGYVLNNPLSMTDTNGQCVFCFSFLVDLLFVDPIALLGKPLFEHVPLLGDLFVIASGIACGPIGPLCAAETAGSIAGVESGSVGKGLEAFALTFAEAGAFHAVGDVLQASKLTGLNFTASAVVAHGLVGGTFSVLRGKSFGSGFLAAGVSELATPYIAKSTQNDPALGTVEAAVVGGTASVLGGGKFGNGAVTGAFGYIYNQWAHDPSGTCQAFHGSPDQCAAVGKAITQNDNFWGSVFLGVPLVGVTLGRSAVWIADLLAGIGGATEGTGTVELSYHAADQAALRGITQDQIYNTIETGQSFQYIQNGETLTGYYDPNTNIFVGVGDRITTVIKPSNPANYIKSLLARGG